MEFGGCFFMGRVGVHGFSVLLGTHPFRDMEGRIFGRRGGFVRSGDGAAMRYQAFDGDDHGEGFLSESRCYLGLPGQLRRG